MTPPAALLVLLAIATSAFATPPPWPPLVSPEVVQVHQLVPEHMRPEAVPEQAAESWDQAKARANMELFRGYLNARLFPLEHPHLASQQWWDQLLETDPPAAALAILELDTRYIVRDVESWPEETKPLLPQYRRAMLKSMTEAYLATLRLRDTRRAEVDAFEPVNLRMPNGLPASDEPSSYPNPELYEEYRKRFEEADRQVEARDRLDHIENTVGQMEHDWPEQIARMLHGASPTEHDSILTIIRTPPFADLPFAASIEQAIVGDSPP